jgi:hypothetical protein
MVVFSTWPTTAPAPMTELNTSPPAWAEISERVVMVRALLVTVPGLLSLTVRVYVELAPMVQV